MHNKIAKRIFKKLDNLSSLYDDFSNIIDRSKKTKKEFDEATNIGLVLYKKTLPLVYKLNKIVNKIECSRLKHAEINELIFLYKRFKKISHKILQNEKKHILFKKIYDAKQNTFIIERNDLFILLVDFICRNFTNITLPEDFDVDKYRNDAKKISLLTMLNSTDWSNFFNNEDIKNNMVDFSNKVLNSTWWNHAKYYRNVFVHRISLDTFYSINYTNLNTRVRTYLPTLCFLCIKYFLFNLANDLIDNDFKNKQYKKSIFSWLKSKKKKELEFNLLQKKDQDIEIAKQANAILINNENEANITDSETSKDKENNLDNSSDYLQVQVVDNKEDLTPSSDTKNDTSFKEANPEENSDLNNNEDKKDSTIASLNHSFDNYEDEDLDEVDD